MLALTVAMLLWQAPSNSGALEICFIVHKSHNDKLSLKYIMIMFYVSDFENEYLSDAETLSSRDCKHFDRKLASPT